MQVMWQKGNYLPKKVKKKILRVFMSLKNITFLFCCSSLLCGTEWLNHYPDRENTL